jgi:Tol biopolymer transport system component
MLKSLHVHARRLLVLVGVLTIAALLLMLMSRSQQAPSHPAPVPPGPGSVRKARVKPREMPPIVFASNRAGAYRLFATDAAGVDPVRVSDEPGMYPAWDPDGSTLVFVGESDHVPDARQREHEHASDHAEAGFTSRRPQLSLIAPDATIRPVATGPQVPSHPTIRRDGTIGYQSTLLDASEAAGLNGRSSIDTVDIDEPRRRTIVDNRGAAYQPAWSPDGTRLAMVLGNKACKSENLCRQRLVLWNPETDARKTLIGRGSAAAPAWSPDGESIAFTWDRGEGPAVWILRIDNGARRRLTAGSEGDAEPTWAPDGRQIAFMRRCDIFVQRLGNRRARNLTRSPDTCEISPAWRPTA